MKSADPLAILAVAERNELEALVMDFDATWQPDSLPKVNERLASHPSQPFRDHALQELIRVDLQRSWSAGDGRHLSDYLARYPELGNRESVAPDLIFAEYEARKPFEPKLDLASYESSYPSQFSKVRELASESFDSTDGKSSNPKSNEHAPKQASIDTSRVDLLRDTKTEKQPDKSTDLPAEFGRYRILKELGAGAMGKVYLAHDNQLDRQVALKTPSFSGPDDDLVTRFYREARSAAKVQHRNICPIYDVGEIDGHHFISMAFIKGRSLSHFVKPGKTPPQRTSAILVQRLAVALSEAHKHNVIHRDLKPANIMIDLKKEPIVMDFGLARQTDVESRVTQSGMAVGTPAYMSPEQIRGELDEVLHTADIYALGVILYELLTGQLPFRGPIAKVVYAIVHEAPAPPSSIRGEVAPELEVICAKMMAKNRDERYQSMDDVAAALKLYLTGAKKTSSADVSSSKHSSQVASDSGGAQLTETGALNAFFAAQADADSRGTLVEPTAIPQRPALPTIETKSARSNGNRRDRYPWVVLGSLGGAALLLGVVIYFKGGKVELDSDSNAVVNVDNNGDVTIRPGSDANHRVAAGKTTLPVAKGPLSSAASVQKDLSQTTPKVDLLNEWDHDGENWTLWLLASLSPNGQRAAFRLGEGPLKISNTLTKEMLKIPSEMEDALSLAFSSDGKLIATGHDNKKIQLWDAESFVPVGEPLESPIEQRVMWVHLSADGKKLIAMGNDHSKFKNMSTFLTWDVPTRRLISRFQVRMDEQKWADSIDASLDGSRVAVVTLREGPTLWDTTTGKRVPVPFDFDERIAGMKRITGMDLSADGSRLVYGTLTGASSFAAILDTTTGQELWNSGQQKGRVHCVQFARNGKWLASTAGRENAHQLSLWDVKTGTEIQRWIYKHHSSHDNADRVKFLSFAEDGSKLLLAGGHMPIVVWSLLKNAPDGQASELSNSPSSPLPSSVVARTARASTGDRQIAEKIIGFGGCVQLTANGTWHWEVPNDEIRVVGVSFFRRQKLFDDSYIALLKHLPSLQTVIFYPNKMTNEGIASLAEMDNVVANVKTLRFHRRPVGPKALAALAKLKQLDTLTLHHTDLVDDDIKLLANLSKLQDLTLEQESKNKFGPAFLTDECLTHLADVSGLRKLTLSGETFTDAGLASVADLKIEELWLATPNITDLAIAELKKKRPRLGVIRYKQSPTEAEDRDPT